ncbi:hydrophobin 2 [Gymnopus androsaceus JB14]|uniref:Hydrophobin n=1 Tax=Gymnopus androsaceus JB14 TaxID=1447944 RepID=A0A6A4HA72_9AGAR|nr:hydrophobin 2 [Gymnopus androsaceus JB14]
MQLRLAFVSAALVTLAFGAPTLRGESPEDCTTGALECCQTVELASNPSTYQLLGLLGIVPNDLNVLVGINCTPIPFVDGVVLGVCNDNPVCCEDNNTNPYVPISIDCVPVAL